LTGSAGMADRAVRFTVSLAEAVWLTGPECGRRKLKSNSAANAPPAYSAGIFKRCRLRLGLSIFTES
jgi:hypothetical protein